MPGQLLKWQKVMMKIKKPEKGQKSQFGLSPLKWCAERMNEKVKVVCPEELFWRVGMYHKPEQTKSVLKKI